MKTWKILRGLRREGVGAHNAMLAIDRPHYLTLALALAVAVALTG